MVSSQQRLTNYFHLLEIDKHHNGFYLRGWPKYYGYTPQVRRLAIRWFPLDSLDLRH